MVNIEDTEESIVTDLAVPGAGAATGVTIAKVTGRSSIKLMGKTIPIIGPLIVAPFVAWETGKNLLKGNFGMAAAELAAGIPEILGSFGGFLTLGLGEAGRQAVVETIAATTGVRAMDAPTVMLMKMAAGYVTGGGGQNSPSSLAAYRPMTQIEFDLAAGKITPMEAARATYAKANKIKEAGLLREGANLLANYRPMTQEEFDRAAGRHSDQPSTNDSKPIDPELAEQGARYMDGIRAADGTVSRPPHDSHARSERTKKLL